MTKAARHIPARYLWLALLFGLLVTIAILNRLSPEPCRGTCAGAKWENTGLRQFEKPTYEQRTQQAFGLIEKETGITGRSANSLLLHIDAYGEVADHWIVVDIHPDQSVSLAYLARTSSDGTDAKAGPVRVDIPAEDWHRFIAAFDAVADRHRGDDLPPNPLFDDLSVEFERRHETDITHGGGAVEEGLAFYRVSRELLGLLRRYLPQSERPGPYWKFPDNR